MGGPCPWYFTHTVSLTGRLFPSQGLAIPIRSSYLAFWGTLTKGQLDATLVPKTSSVHLYGSTSYSVTVHWPGSLLHYKFLKGRDLLNFVATEHKAQGLLFMWSMISINLCGINFKTHQIINSSWFLIKGLRFYYLILSPFGKWHLKQLLKLLLRVKKGFFLPCTELS